MFALVKQKTTAVNFQKQKIAVNVFNQSIWKFALAYCLISFLGSMRDQNVNFMKKFWPKKDSDNPFYLRKNIAKNFKNEINIHIETWLIFIRLD